MKSKNILPLIVYPVNMGYVNDLKPTIHGTGEPKATINGSLDNAPFNTTVLDNGVWSYNLQNNLVDNTEHILIFTQTDLNGNISPAINVQFKTDTKALLQQVIDYPTNNQYINTKIPIIGGTGKPIASIELSIAGTTYTTIVNHDGIWQIQITEPLPEGSNSINVIQKDMGNISPMLNVNFTIDTVVPEMPVIDTSLNVNTPKPVVSGKGEANATINATFDNKEYTTTVNQDGLWNFEVGESLMDDTHIFSARQKDVAGNISAEKISLITVDTKQPETPLVLKPLNGEHLSEPLLVIQGQGEKEARVEAKLNENIYSSEVDKNGAWNIKVPDKLLDNTYTFKVYQVDKAGNVSPSTTLTVIIDTAIPLAPIVLYPENESYINNLNFTIKGTGEPDATIECIFTGKILTTRVTTDGSWSVDICNNIDIRNSTKYSITATQTDLAGNISPPIKVKFVTDMSCLKAPAIILPTNNSFINTATPTFSGTGKSGAIINILINSDTYSTEVLENGTWTITIDKIMQQGENTVNVYQSDSGNTSASTTRNFTIDTINPLQPQITYPTENVQLDINNFIINGNGEANATIFIKLDEKNYSTTVKADNTWDFTVPDVLPNGLHSIITNQADTAGNASLFSQVNFTTAIAQQTATNDASTPVCEILYNPPGPNWATKVIAILKSDKPITVNNINGNIFTKIVTTNGTSNFNFTDSAGNVGTKTMGVTWIDNKPPVIQIQSNGNYFSSDKTVSYYKPDGSIIKNALLNGIPFESGKVITNEAIYKVEVTDQVGNMAVEEFVIDKTPPDVLGIVNNMVYNTDVIIPYFDNISGVKCAVINGQNIESGAAVTANGDYTLTVTDYGDNSIQRNFSIQK